MACSTLAGEGITLRCTVYSIIYIRNTAIMVTSGRNYSAVSEILISRQADPWKLVWEWGRPTEGPRVCLVCSLVSSGLNPAYNVESSEMMMGVKGSCGDSGLGGDNRLLSKNI